ncbi:MAG: 2-C-methyl-D-erythritol 4-phosphate cytidylyltransferase [Chthoniobacterales bacterium]
MNHSLVSSPITAALIVAAGSSTRFGSDKLMATIHGKPLITYSLRAFSETPFISSIMLVVPPGREAEFRKIVDSLKIPHLTAMTHIISGGKTRYASVQNGLQALRALSASTQFVAIHDAARPLITRAQIESVCRAAYKEGAAALALPVVETLHRADVDGYAQETVDRQGLWSMQTPQVFSAIDLVSYFALKKINNKIDVEKKLYTDEVSAFLQQGVKVRLIENREPNIKVTYPADLNVVQNYLR